MEGEGKKKDRVREDINISQVIYITDYVVRIRLLDLPFIQ